MTLDQIIREQVQAARQMLNDPDIPPSLEKLCSRFLAQHQGNKMTRLGQMITAYEQKHDVQSKQVAKEIGIGQSTLTRIKQGAATDAGNLVKIITWMMKEREE